MKISWCPTGRSCSLEELKEHGIVAETNPDLDAKAAELGYIERDLVFLTPETYNLDEILVKFRKEHYHDHDEVRYINAGEGVFDIRPAGNDGAHFYDSVWIRIEVSQGDYIQIPAGRYHRFFLTEMKTISAARLFEDESGWVAHYREDVQETKTKSELL